MRKLKGWKNEPGRHSLAAKGVKTGRKPKYGSYSKKMPIPEITDRYQILKDNRDGSFEVYDQNDKFVFLAKNKSELDQFLKERDQKFKKSYEPVIKVWDTFNRGDKLQRVQDYNDIVIDRSMRVKVDTARNDPDFLDYFEESLEY